MRNLAWSVVVVTAVAAGWLGCGGSTPRTKPDGSAGNTGTAGTGAAGTSAAGTGAAGTGAAGTAAAGTGAAGTGDAGTGAAGTGAAGTAAAGTGAAGTAPPPPPPTYCETHPQQALPYNIATDFKVVHTLNNNNSAGTAWKYIANPTCDATTFPPFPVPPSDGGSDGGDGGTSDAAEEGGSSTDGGVADGATDAADDTLTLALADDAGVDDAATDAAADAPVDAPASVDSAADGSAGDVAMADGGGSDGAVAGPACYEFSYNPADCVGTCWAGSVFQIDDMQPAHPNGVCIKPGAMSVEFWARSSREGARVKFGSIGEGQGSREQFVNITTAWAKYTIPIPAGDQNTYNSTSDNMNGVWNAFSVVVEPQDHTGGTYILVKDIRWLATP